MISPVVPLQLGISTIIGLIFHFVQAHCLAWVTAVAVLCSSSNIPTSFNHHDFFPLWTHFGESLVAHATQPSLIGLSDAYDVFDSLAAFHLLGQTLHTWFYFWIHLLNDLVNWVLHHYMKAYFPNFEFFYQWRYHLCRYSLLYCWIRSMWDCAISYICKGHKRRGSRPC